MSISSIPTFLEQLKNLSRDKDCEYFFRGHNDTSYSLTPSIYRRSLIRNEDKFFKEIILRAPNDFSTDKTTIEKLVKMQHYSLPTRLLDITSNPLVALYFASDGSPKKDGEVIVLKVPKAEIKFYDSDTVTILANIAKRPYDLSIDGLDLSDDDRDEFNDSEPIAKLLHEIRDDKSHFHSIIDYKDLSKVLAVKVKLNNNRIVKQSGAFFLFGFNRKKSNPAIVPDNWIVSKSKLDFIVSASDKENVLTELDTLGINEGSLFPELDNQSKYLKKLYK
jgi:hypothetical protein